MARQGRRLTIGGAGPLTGDDQLSQTGARGEVARFVPLTEDEVQQQAAAIGRTGENAPADAKPTTMLIFPGVTGSGGAGEGNAGPGPGEGEGSGTGEGSVSAAEGDTGTSTSTFKRGGPVKGSSAEHAITAQAGEYVINRDAVKKYGQPLFDALNSGAALSTNSNDMLQHFASGGKVGDGSRFAAFVAKLKSQGKSASSAAAIAASEGRAKYGASRFNAMAAAGRKRHSLAS